MILLLSNKIKIIRKEKFLLLMRKGINKTSTRLTAIIDKMRKEKKRKRSDKEKDQKNYRNRKKKEEERDQNKSRGIKNKNSKKQQD